MYAIKRINHYYPGSLCVIKEEYLTDERNKLITYRSKADADKQAERINQKYNNPDYRLAHNEYAPPEFVVRRVRKNC